MAKQEPTKSKLIKLLQQISHGTAARIGLVQMKEQYVPAMAIVVGLQKADPQLLAALADADAIALSTKEALARWDELAKSAGEKPFGMLLEAGSKLDLDDFKKYLEKRPDFFIAPPDAVPATLLNAKETGRVVAIDASYSAQLVRALGELSVDAVLADVAITEKSTVFTVRDLLHFRQIVDLVHCPTLVMADENLSPELLPQLRDMGVEGLVVRLSTTAKPDEIKARIAEYRAEIGKLGKSVGRGRESRVGAMLPRVGPLQSAAPEPEEEPDDE